MNNEAALILSSVIAGQVPEAEEKCRALLTEERMDWGRLLYYAVHHRVAPIVYKNLDRLGLLKQIELQVLNTLKMISKTTKLKNEGVLAEVFGCLETLRGQNCMPILLKGPAVEIMAYQEIGMRTYEDVDLLVRREDAKTVDEVLRASGFLQGEYDQRSRRVTPASRADVLRRSLNTHETAEYVKVIDDDRIEAVIVDVNFEIFWKGPKAYSERHRIETEALLSQTVEVPAGGSRLITTLRPEFQIVQLAAHLFSEAILFFFHKNWFRDKHDLQLIKFLDVYMVIHAGNVNFDVVYDFCVKHDALMPVFYTLSYLNKLFGTKLPKCLSPAGDEDLANWLDAYMDKEGRFYQWQTCFEDRMFDMSKKIEEIRARFPSLRFAS